MPKCEAVFSDESGSGHPARVELIETADADAAFRAAKGRQGPHEALVNMTPVDEDGNVFALGGPDPSGT